MVRSGTDWPLPALEQVISRLSSVPVLEPLQVVLQANFADLSSSAYELVDASQAHGDGPFGKCLPDFRETDKCI
jgi:hypothetical protein